MLLEKYLVDCFNDESTKSPSSLTLPIKGILSDFRNMRGHSELSGLEYGMNLYWSGDTIDGYQVPPSNSESAVDLNTRNIRYEESYIGDCHTHPYKLKMGNDAHIGPSTSDYMEWWMNPPYQLEIALHFVISGSTVFLVVCRQRTTGYDEEPNFRALSTVDTARLNQYGRTDEMNKVQVDVYRLDRRTKNQRLKQAWQAHFPNAPSEFAADNLQMNIEMANQHHFDYYAGDMDRNGRASFCELKLQSKPAYPGSSCFITTAACAALGQGDDCETLNALRSFRDDILLMRGGFEARDYIDEYYALAPKIVTAIECGEDPKGAYLEIFQGAIAPAAQAVKAGRYDIALSAYRTMVRSFSRRYL